MSRARTTARWAAVVVAAGLLGAAAGFGVARLAHPPPPPPAPFAPPPETAIGEDPLGREVALGRRIFTDTGHEVPRLVGNDLKCSNCHLDAGRRAGAAPLWAAYGLYPQFRKKNGHVNDFGERIRECFRYSMNGVEPPADDPAVLAIETYAAFLARGAPVGRTLPGQGYRRLAPPPQPASFERGQAVFRATCARCHGPDG
ncbi:MAG: cytochrome C, partial [Proteobacteria bacterium]|nr:cytochrome C [Pseudomonadota bacterium]